MNIAFIILYVSMFIFLFPPFRQYKGPYFYFFFLLAVEDPVAKLLKELFWIYQAKVHVIFSIFLVMSILNIKNVRKYFNISIPIIIISIIGISFLDNTNKDNINLLRITVGLFHLVIFFIFVKKSVIFLRENMGINIFQTMLILYESTIILKFIIYILNIPKGMLFFYITTAFEWFLGLFFAFYREDNPKLVIYIKDKAEQLPE